MRATSNLEWHNGEEMITVGQQAYFSPDKFHGLTEITTPRPVMFTETGLTDLLNQVREAKEKFMGKMVWDYTNEVGTVVNVVIDHCVNGPILIIETENAELKWQWEYAVELIHWPASTRKQEFVG